ncbi:hypothetical protein CYMTET_4153 [Cymbomonas tetramitiformis]|uniref:Phospho-N-acetylmuramoyl-pentapeptide-transferase n=1 Tax=Cymbomonas tetramitiformis TaxID=36881 RepID=A0AAE0H1R2_9CHLO|nr:hypothetical protein CYMTET_4153 [Cymbomonas tetramitiformis]
MSFHVQARVGPHYLTSLLTDLDVAKRDIRNMPRGKRVMAPPIQSGRNPLRRRCFKNLADVTRTESDGRVLRLSCRSCKGPARSDATTPEPAAEYGEGYDFGTTNETHWTTQGYASAVALVVGLAGSMAALQTVAGTWAHPTLFFGFVAAMLLSGLLSWLLLPILRAFKFGQVVRSDGPQSHLAEKSGTPTMGGLAFIPAGVLVGVLCTSGHPASLATGAATLGFALIGALDDGLALRFRNSQGAPPKLKLALQTVVGALLCAWTFQHPFSAGSVWSTIQLPGGISMPVSPILAWPAALFVITAESNGANLTGAASSPHP